jgi:hypothetical protein
MHLKGALHVHTTCSDGRMTIQEALTVYAGLGFDFVALTDHDHLLRPNAYDVIQDLRTDLIVFAGVELTVFEKGYVHVNRIWGEHEQLHIFNHPAELNLPLEKAAARIQAVARRLPIDAVEITAKGFRTPEYETDRIAWPKVATDDAHTRSMCGRAWIEMDGARDKDQIIRAVKQGDFWNCFAGSPG